MTLDATPPKFGMFEDEAVDDGRIAIAGGGVLPRPLREGEHVVLIVEGTAGLPSYERDKKTGRLRRVDRVLAVTVGEPAEDLADEAERYLATIRALEETDDPKLPLDGEDAEGDDA